MITVVAGVNGAGKSSVAGERLRADGGEYFNPDEVAQRFLEAGEARTLAEANGLAWQEGYQHLAVAVRTGQDYTFETTLGGESIAKLLGEVLTLGHEVALVFVGLASAELHIARVQSRVSAGGHPIPEEKIRERYTSSIQNLVKLAPRLSMLRLLDNSVEADPKTGQRPEPRELLHAEEGQILRSCELPDCPAWAKPIFAVLLNRG